MKVKGEIEFTVMINNKAIYRYMELSGLTDVIYLIINVDIYDARREERLGENRCELSG